MAKAGASLRICSKSLGPIAKTTASELATIDALRGAPVVKATLARSLVTGITGVKPSSLRIPSRPLAKALAFGSPSMRRQPSTWLLPCWSLVRNTSQIAANPTRCSASDGPEASTTMSRLPLRRRGAPLLQSPAPNATLRQPNWLRVERVSSSHGSSFFIVRRSWGRRASNESL